MSLQDLKGSIRFGGVYQKLDEVADLTWDVLIIDEAHEGVDTFKTDVAFDHIKRRFTLHLSGTPFKAIANEKFADDAIYNWTYADEQQAKRDWPADSEQPNPYANLPKLNLLTYQMSDIVEREARGGMEIDGEQTEFAFDLNEFFSTKQNGGFVHDATWTSSSTRSPRRRSSRSRHPGCATSCAIRSGCSTASTPPAPSPRNCRRTPSSRITRWYSLLATARSTRRREREVARQGAPRDQGPRQDHHPFGRPAHHGRDRAGVDRRAHALEHGEPALYMQAAFRSQNPCLFDLGGGNYARKENAYVFDFDPARTLTIFEQFANDLYGETARGGGDVETRERISASC